MAVAAATTTMKLLIDGSKPQHVLFAEAGKDVVDLLFSFLALPVSTALKLVGKDRVGSVGNLYASVEELDSTYVLQGASKAALLRPTAASPDSSSISSLFCLPESSSWPPKSFYRCKNAVTNYSYSCHAYVTDVHGKECPVCRFPMTTEAQYLSGETTRSAGKTAGSAGKGFVQGIVTYTVLDNLTVKPVSAISSINLLNTLAVTDIDALQEKTVQVGYNEGLAILKASLQSKTVLTDVFLRNNVIDEDNYMD